MSTFSLEATLRLQFSFLPPYYIGGKLSKERICSPMSKFFHFKVEPNLKELLLTEKQTGSHKNCFPFVK